jgi:hypothetical protein
MVPGLRTPWRVLAEALTVFLADNPPTGQSLAPAIEGQLARYCYLLAMYEVIFRGGLTESPLLDLPRAAPLADQLALAPEADVADLVALTGAAALTFADLDQRPIVPNPTFAGSPDIGGADADFIVGDCLIDLKTTTKTSLDRKHVYQLVAYALLDYEDAFAIRNVGLYGSRIPTLLTWPLETVIDDMSGGRATVSLLRDRLRSLLRQPPPASVPAPDQPRPNGTVARPWTSEDDQMLTQLASDGVPIGLAANQLDRAYNTVLKHARSLGLQFERDRYGRTRHKETEA